MALRYYEEQLGKVIIKQRKRENGEFVLNEKGKQVWNKYEVQIRRGNCLAVFIHAYKDGDKWMHQLYTFFADSQHMRNMMHDPHMALHGTKNHLIPDEVVRIELNMAYEECETLLKYLTRDGYVVKCYYKKPKTKK